MAKFLGFDGGFTAGQFTSPRRLAVGTYGAPADGAQTLLLIAVWVWFQEYSGIASWDGTVRSAQSALHELEKRVCARAHGEKLLHGTTAVTQFGRMCGHLGK